MNVHERIKLHQTQTQKGCCSPSGYNTLIFSFFGVKMLLEKSVPEPPPPLDFSGSNLYVDVLTVGLSKPSGVV